MTQLAIPLSGASVGVKYLVSHVSAGTGLSKRLAEMGFAARMPISVCGGHGGSLIVMVGGNRLAVGRGVAHKIAVVEVGPNE